MSEDVPLAMGGFGPGARVGDYLLEEQIGHGGMAVVFRALDERLGRRVALKILAPALAADEAFRQRFIRESRAAAAVDDPHIIPLFEAGEAAGVLFIAMRYVRGRDVRSLLVRDGPLPAARVAAIVAPVALALDAAHAAGLVHRDVKPANMLLDSQPGRSDHVYLSDFGLSKEAFGSVGLTGSGQFLGTVDYAAPEQIGGGEVDGRADQYALGCAAFEMLSGEPPFRRDQAMAVLFAHLSEPPPQVTRRRQELPGGLDQVFMRVLAKAPRDRYQTCREFSDALRGALGLPPYDAAAPAAPAPAAARAASAAHPATQVAPAVIAPGATAAAAIVGAQSGMPTSPTGSPGAGRPGGRGSGDGRRPARRWPVAVGSAAGAAAVVAVVFILTAHAISPPAARSGSSNPAGTGSSRAESPRASSPAASTSSPAVSSPAAAATGAAATPTVAAPPPGAVDNIWIAQLASVAHSAGTARLDQELARIQQQVPGAQVLDSSDYASLRANFWVIYYAGAFANGTQALDYCASVGRTTSDQCIGRYLSHNAADFNYQCRPPASNPSPLCTHR